MGISSNVSSIDNGTGSLARRYGRAMSVIYGQQQIKGRIVKATRGARHLSLGVRLADPLKLDTALRLSEPIALQCRCPAVLAQRSQADPGLVSYQFQLARRAWRTVTRADVDGLGVGQGEGQQQIDFTFDPPHAGVFGTTGSGKSEAIKSILAALFLTYPPGALGAVIVDPHSDFGDFAHCAHLAAPIDQRGGDALAWAGQELARREGSNARDSARLLVVIDEAEKALGTDGRLLEIAKAIASGGRKFGVHLVIGTQDAKERTLPGLVSLVNNRWVGLVANAQVSATLTGQAGIEAHKLTGKGDFVHVAGATVERLQFALAQPQDLARLPRVDAVPEPEIEPEDTPAVVNAVKQVGRPPIEVEPANLASYLYFGAGNVSIREAKDKLGLSRTAHEKHRDFALEVERGLDWLKNNESEDWKE